MDESRVEHEAHFPCHDEDRIPREMKYKKNSGGG